MGQIRTLADIEAIERVPLAERQLPQSTYTMHARAMQSGRSDSSEDEA